MENLMPSFRDEEWKSFSPEGQEVRFFLEEAGARIVTAEGHFGLGKWISELSLNGDKAYDFSVEAESALAEEDLYVLLTQYDADGKMIIREHAHTAFAIPNGIRFEEKLVAAKECVRLRVELWVKGMDASALWKNPCLTKGEAPVPRRVRVAPIHIKHPGRSLQEQISALLAAVDRAGEMGCDVIVLGEGVIGRGLGLALAELGENEDSQIPMLLRERAKRYRTYIVYNTVEIADGAFYNTSFLFGREGELVGKYRKTHLPVTEYEAGFAPGNEYPVFDLDFGRIGLLICYDQFFARTVDILADRGAELICIPSAGDMSHCCFSRAMERGVYLAVAGMNNENGYGWGATRVVDPLGRILAQTDEEWGIALCEIDLSHRVRRRWMSTGTAFSDVHDDYRFEKNSKTYQ